MGPPQDRYYNAAVLVETSLDARGLLEVCRRAEAEGGRERTVHWGPRTIDLDIIDAGGAVIDSPDLKLPHPGVSERAFVLVPLADVLPDWRHPVTGERLRVLLGRCNVRGVVPVPDASLV